MIRLARIFIIMPILQWRQARIVLYSRMIRINLRPFEKGGKPIGHQARYLAIGNYGSIDDVFNYAQSGTINSISPNQVIPGDLVYIDFDANGILNGQDKVAVDQLNYPLHTYGLDLGFNWRG